MLRKITFSCIQCGSTERLVVTEDEKVRPLCKHCLPSTERVTGVVLERSRAPTTPGACP